MSVNPIVSNLQELTADSESAVQPTNINITLRPHQLTLLKYCQQLEAGQVAVDLTNLPANIHSTPSTRNVSCNMKTRVGIIADKVGSGKSNVVLSLIASDIESTDLSSQVQSTYTFGFNKVTLTLNQERTMSNINILTIPHNLVSQWTAYVKNFYKNDIKVLTISKAKHIEGITPETITGYQFIIVTTTFYPTLVHLLRRTNIQVRRAIYDEVDSMNITTAEIIDASFYWFVTASYMNLIHPRGYGRFDRTSNCYVVIAEGMRTGGYIRTLFSNLHASAPPTPNRSITNLIVAKNNDTFVDQSIHLPAIDFQYIRCKTPRTINILEGIVDRHIIQCLNSGDIDGAIRNINPSHCNTQENIINILLEKYTRNLHNVNSMVDYVTNHMQYYTEQQRDHELERLYKKRDDFVAKVASITSRIKESDTCCICFETIANKTIVNCCMNSFCFKCISTWVTNRHVCPLCKESLDVDKFFVVRDDDAESSTTAIATVPTPDTPDPAKPHKSFDKMRNLENVIRQISESNPNNKLLIFSMNEGIFDKIQEMLNTMDRTFKLLKGTNVSISNTVDRYKNGDLNTLLVNPENYGSGLNLENTTDMIMLHKFDNEVEKQVIGRAQRYGRTTPLRVWYLLYENEFSVPVEQVQQQQEN